MAYSLPGMTKGEYPKGMDLKSAALRFIGERCEGLRFDGEKAAQEEKTGELLGTALTAGQIPYNMEMDIDRLCLQNALSTFLDSGAAEDALPVYLCYLEMFAGDYSKTRSMVELLSEYESNGSSLLLKHRDHYSHSVYVFALGLAIYETNSAYRRAYAKFYGLRSAGDAAKRYLEYWGMTALFHDIGYPFELPFEQIASYFEVNRDKRDDKPYMAYRRLEGYTAFDVPMKRRVAALYPELGKVFENTDELFAFALEQRLGKAYTFDRRYMEEVLRQKPTCPEKFNNFMDHGYFSALVTFRRLYGELGKELTVDGMDAVTAILLHNSLYKFSVAHYKDPAVNVPLKPELHPLAYMLFLCDELQCWDRTAYGRNSRSELNPMEAEFDFTGEGIRVCFLYDREERDKLEEYEEAYGKWMAEKPGEIPGDRTLEERTRLWKKGKPKLKECSNMILRPGQTRCDYTEDIASIVSLERLPLEVTFRWEESRPGRKHLYISGSNFIHLYNFAIALNGQYALTEEWTKAKKEGRSLAFVKAHEKEFEDAFRSLSLEYQLFNINQARAFAAYLQAIGCFYTDRTVDYPVVTAFSEEELETIGRMEHDRWVAEHELMGWRYGKPKNKRERENLRIHPDMVPFGDLPGEEPQKDKEPFALMLVILRLYDGLRIYRL